jgi:hypothetical protein
MHTKVHDLAATMHRIDPNTPEGAAFVLGPQSAMISLNLETLRGQVSQSRQPLHNHAIFCSAIFVCVALHAMMLDHVHMHNDYRT